MKDFHPKIDPKDVQDDGFLLNEAERSRVREIQTHIKKFQDEARPHLQALSTATLAEAEAQALCDLAHNPADKIMELSISPIQHVVEYRANVLAKLEDLKSMFKDDDVKHFLDDLKSKLENIPIPDQNDARDELNMQYDELIDDMVSNLGMELVDPNLVATASNTQTTQMDLKNAAEQALEAIRLKIQGYQSENKLDFDLDHDFNLTKISKRSEGLNFSVIFAQKNNQEHEAYALYRGKEKILGQGGFGTVKFCQHLETGEWQAVKIIQAFAKSDSKFENEVLDTLERYHGDALRGGKYYALQTLLPGVELKKHLDEGVSPDIASRLEIAKQAASLLDKFHAKFLHRDIKPENFIWDEGTKTLSLCDFGLSCGLGQEETSAFGSDGFIAPEIDNAPPGQPVPYSEKSDIYALGKTFDALFKGVDDVPDEIQALIANMTQACPEKRAGDLKQIQAVCEDVLNNIPSPKGQHI
ncbi:MAG: protein kinase [Legionella sp.]|nr:protein kinase [Legionella sp.]